MKRDKSGTPTRIYTYGCLPPIQNAEIVDEQLRRAHRYRNALVPIEMRRRARIESVQRAHATLGPLIELRDMYTNSIVEIYMALHESRSGGGDSESRLALAEQLAVLKAERKEIWETLRRTKAELCDPKLIAAYEAVTEQADEENKGPFNAPDAPYDGTKAAVRDLVLQWRTPDKNGRLPEPRDKPYRGEGRIAWMRGPMPVADLFAAEHGGLRLTEGHPIAPPRTVFSSRRQIDRAVAYAIVSFFRGGAPMMQRGFTAWIRVGSSDKREPIWAQFPVIVHRPLPDDAVVRSAWVVRKRIGLRFRYAFQLAIKSASFTVMSKIGPSVAIDVGGRDLPDGETRVASWMDSLGTVGTVDLPLTRRVELGKHQVRPAVRGSVPNDMGKVDRIKSIRGGMLDDIRAAVIAHRSAGNEWFRTETTHAHLKRTPKYFVWLLRDWQSHDGDKQILERLTYFVKQDRHLYDWESHESHKHSLRRREIYRVFAAKIAREYATIILVQRDYRRKQPAPEDGPRSLGRETRKLLREAAPGELVTALKQAAKKSGTTIRTIPVEGDTSGAIDWKVCQWLLSIATSPASGGKNQRSKRRIKRKVLAARIAKRDKDKE